MRNVSKFFRGHWGVTSAKSMCHIAATQLGGVNGICLLGHRVLGKDVDLEGHKRAEPPPPHVHPPCSFLIDITPPDLQRGVHFSYRKL